MKLYFKDAKERKIILDKMLGSLKPSSETTEYFNGKEWVNK